MILIGENPFRVQLEGVDPENRDLFGPWSECHLGPKKSKWYQAEWLERLTANAEVATVLGSIPAFYDSVESEGRQILQCYGAAWLRW